MNNFIKRNLKQFSLIIIYLATIILSNLLITKFGTLIVIPVGFVLVGLDITTRDSLHELWPTKRWVKMGSLIAVGSFLSWVLNKDSGIIALASFIAFASSQFIDSLVYMMLKKYHYLLKVNGSNLFSALVDSTVFLSIAFGQFMPLLILAQFSAKFIGGFVWSLILRKVSTNKARMPI